MIDFRVIGNRIRHYRKKGGLTQSYVASTLDVSVSYISQIERGVAELSLVRLDEIACIIRTKTEYLISDTDEASPLYLNSELFQVIKDWDADKKKLLVKIAYVIDET